MRRYTTVAAQVRAATEWPQPNALHFSQYTPPVSLALIGSHRAHQPAATRGGDFPLKLLLGREQVERGGRCPIASLQARFDCPLNEINSITIKYFVLFMADLELGDCGEIRAESGRGGHKNSTLLCPCFTFQGLATFWKRQIRNGGIIIRGSRQIPHRIKPELFFGHHKKIKQKKLCQPHLHKSEMQMQIFMFKYDTVLREISGQKWRKWFSSEMDALLLFAATLPDFWATDCVYVTTLRYYSQCWRGSTFGPVLGLLTLFLVLLHKFPIGS